MNRDQIILAIRGKIDELSYPQAIEVNDGVFEGLNANLEDSFNTFMRTAPLWILSPREVPIIDHTVLPNGGGRIALPGDFLRLHTFKMKEWVSPVVTPMGEDHPNYFLRENPYIFTPMNPFVAIIDAQSTGMQFQTPTSRKYLEYYGVKNFHQIEKAFYVPRVNRTKNLVDHLPTTLVEGAIWQAVVDFFITVQQPTMAEAARIKLREFLFGTSTYIPPVNENK